MNAVNKERYQIISEALSAVSVETFLVIGLRKTSENAEDECEVFYCLRGDDKTLLLEAIKEVFLKNLDLAEIIVEILSPIFKELKKSLIVGQVEGSA